MGLLNWKNWSPLWQVAFFPFAFFRSLFSLSLFSLSLFFRSLLDIHTALMREEIVSGGRQFSQSLRAYLRKPFTSL